MGSWPGHVLPSSPGLSPAVSQPEWVVCWFYGRHMAAYGSKATSWRVEGERDSDSTSREHDSDISQVPAKVFVNLFICLLVILAWQSKSCPNVFRRKVAIGPKPGQATKELRGLWHTADMSPYQWQCNDNVSLIPSHGAPFTSCCSLVGAWQTADNDPHQRHNTTVLNLRCSDGSWWGNLPDGGAH